MSDEDIAFCEKKIYAYVSEKDFLKVKKMTTYSHRP